MNFGCKGTTKWEKNQIFFPYLTDFFVSLHANLQHIHHKYKAYGKKIRFHADAPDEYRGTCPECRCALRRGQETLWPEEVWAGFQEVVACCAEGAQEGAVSCGAMLWQGAWSEKI